MKHGELKTYGKVTLYQRFCRWLQKKEWFVFSTLLHPSEWEDA